MGFSAMNDVPSSLRSVLSGKAPHLPAAFTPGQHHLPDYGGCHLSSLSLTVKDSPVLLTKQREDWLWWRNSLQGWQAFFKWESDFKGRKGGWEGGNNPQRPTATTLHLHRELKFA